MLNHKKILSILFISLIITSLAGCGGGSSTQTISTGSPAGGGNTGTGGSGGTVAGTLLWTPPVTNTDGSPATDLSGYKVYYGYTSRNYIGSINIVGKDATSIPVDTLASAVPAPGTYFIAVTVYDTSGIESDYSNEVSKTL